MASGPVLGYVWDAAASGLYPIMGVAGAAYEGAPSYNDGSYTGAVVCSQKSFALLTAKDGSVSLASLPGGEPLHIAARLSAQQKIILSPSCTAALLFAPGSASAVIISGLPSEPVLKTIEIPATASIAGAAISDAGSLLIASSQTDGSVAIQSISSSSGATVAVAVLSKYGGLAFLPNADTALLADAAKNVVILASEVTGRLSLTQIASAADGVSQPVAIAASADGRNAAVANQSGLVRLDLSRQSSPVKVTCHCTPTELVPLSGNLLFRLNEPGSGTVWAFDGGSPAPRVVFLPGGQRARAVGAAQ